MRRVARSKGFSLLEMLVSTAVLLVVAGAAFSALNSYQKTYGSEQLKTDVHAGLRSAIELMTQEIGQAGSLNFALRTLAPNVSGSTTAQSVTLNPAAGATSATSDIFVDEQLLVDTGAAQELVQVTAVNGNAVTGVFKNNHNNGAPVTAEGAFPQGVLSASTGTNLKLFGDLAGDGSLVYVEYICDTTTGTLTRSITPFSSAAINPSQILLSNLVANPGGTPCFQYATSVTAAGFTFVPSLGITLTVQTAERDPVTEQPLTITKSFLNLAPRNVLAGLNLAATGSASRLQPTPTGVTTLSAD